MDVTGYTMFEATQHGKMQYGRTVHAFRTLKDLKDFLRWTGGGGSAHFKYYEVTGDLIKDEGGRDGLQIRVRSFKEVSPNP